MTVPKEYIIERKPVKHARINVNEKQVVKLIIPNHFSEEEIGLLVKQKFNWINEQIEKFKAEENISIEVPKGNILFLGKAHPKPDGDIAKWYKTEAKKYFNQRIVFLAEKHGFDYHKVFIRDTSSKWGNCSKEKNVSFNWRLIKAPQAVIEYVILHELCHTVILKHTQAFWLKLSTVYPNYIEQANWLKKYGKSLF